jgi:hypothetical protein
VAEIVTASDPGSAIAEVKSDVSRYSRANDVIMNKMPDLVKGAGMALPGGNKPLDNEQEIFSRSYDATAALRGAVKQGISNPSGVMKSWSPEFNSQFGLFQAALGAPQASAQGAIQDLVNQLNSELGKSFSLNGFTNTSVTGLVPYDLVAPSRLIYPVYSPLRNKIARVPGQGTSRQTKVITGISGSQTDGGSANGGGTGAFKDISISETNPNGSYPGALPASGSQSEVDINVAYKFFGLTESLSWLSQFSGQGFEDISALANLILLQEFMLNEEAQIIAGTSTAVVAPTTAPTVTTRTAGTGETGFTLPGTHFRIYATAANYFGETVVTTASTDITAGTAGVVADVTLNQNLPAGALWWNIYVSTNASPATANEFLWASKVGGSRYTLQGPTIPSSGTTPPASDSGTSAATRMPGLIPVLTGQAAANGMYGTAAQTAGWSAGYYQPNTQTHLSISSVNRMLAGLWDGDSQFGNSVAGAFRADPTELIGEGSDIMALSNDVVQSGTATNYRLMIDQPDVSGLRAGAAVSEFQNPITRSVMRLLVHPWWPQGTAVAMSYTLPFSWSNVNNVWEMTMVQDYVSVSWPVIDPTFRYSMFMYGALICNAPQYCGIMQGLQRSDVTPYA